MAGLAQIDWTEIFVFGMGLQLEEQEEIPLIDLTHESEDEVTIEMEISSPPQRRKAQFRKANIHSMQPRLVVVVEDDSTDDEGWPSRVVKKKPSNLTKKKRGKKKFGKKNSFYSPH